MRYLKALLLVLLATGIFCGSSFADGFASFSGFQGSRAKLESKTSYAAGTAYALTNSAAALDFGTTDPSITIDRPGTWLIFGRAVLKYNAATFVASQTATIKLRRTNNTAADLTSATTTLPLRILTATTDGAGTAVIPPVLYTTTRTDDIVKVFGSISAATGAGTVDVTESEIVAIRII